MLTNCILSHGINCVHCSTSLTVHGAHTVERDEREMAIFHMWDIQLTLNLKINIPIYTMIETCLTTVVRESAKTNWSRLNSDDNDIGIRRICYWQLIGIGIELSHDKLTILIEIACRYIYHSHLIKNSPLFICFHSLSFHHSFLIAVVNYNLRTDIQFVACLQSTNKYTIICTVYKNVFEWTILLIAVIYYTIFDKYRKNKLKSLLLFHVFYFLLGGGRGRCRNSCLLPFDFKYLREKTE